MQCSICIDPRVTAIKPGGWSGWKMAVVEPDWMNVKNHYYMIISLIKLDKSFEEPTSSEAGERKEPMLKSRSLESIFGQFGFFGDAYSWE